MLFLGLQEFPIHKSSCTLFQIQMSRPPWKHLHVNHILDKGIFQRFWHANDSFACLNKGICRYQGYTIEYLEYSYHFQCSLLRSISKQIHKQRHIINLHNHINCNDEKTSFNNVQFEYRNWRKRLKKTCLFNMFTNCTDSMR